MQKSTWKGHCHEIFDPLLLALKELEKIISENLRFDDYTVYSIHRHISV